MTTSASGRCFSNSEFGPSWSLVTMSSWPSFSKYLRRPSSPETHPTSSPGFTPRVPFGVGGSLAVGVTGDGRDPIPRIDRRVSSLRVGIKHTQYLRHFALPFLLSWRHMVSLPARSRHIESWNPAAQRENNSFTLRVRHARVLGHYPYGLRCDRSYRF